MMFYPEGIADERVALAKKLNLSWPHTRSEVSQMSAFEAKKAGDVGFKMMKNMGIETVTFGGQKMKYWTSEKSEHYHLIVEAMKEKLLQNKNVRKILLATGNLILRPDHHQPEDAPPSWRYCEIWMELRGELQKGTLKP